jgi:hypothetical protein
LNFLNNPLGSDILGEEIKAKDRLLRRSNISRMHRNEKLLSPEEAEIQQPERQEENRSITKWEHYKVWGSACCFRHRSSSQEKLISSSNRKPVVAVARTVKWSGGDRMRCEC